MKTKLFGIFLFLILALSFSTIAYATEMLENSASVEVDGRVYTLYASGGGHIIATCFENLAELTMRNARLGIDSEFNPNYPPGTFNSGIPLFVVTWSNCPTHNDINNDYTPIDRYTLSPRIPLWSNGRTFTQARAFFDNVEWTITNPTTDVNGISVSAGMRLYNRGFIIDSNSINQRIMPHSFAVRHVVGAPWDRSVLSLIEAGFPGMPDRVVQLF